MKKLSARKIKKLLEFKLDVKIFDEITSTNDYAKNVTCGAFFALRQTAGRGRTSRKFYSGEGGLYFSLALPLSQGEVIFGSRSQFSAGRLTVSAGIAVAKTLIDLGYDAQLKWVNDVFVGGKKVCGILAEGLGDKAVLGIGVNLASDIPDELKDVAVSLGYDGDFNAVAASIINGIARELSAPDMDFFNARCFTLGKRVRTRLGIGRAVGVTDSGALLVETDGTVSEVLSGEAEILSGD